MPDTESLKIAPNALRTEPRPLLLAAALLAHGISAGAQPLDLRQPMPTAASGLVAPSDLVIRVASADVPRKRSATARQARAPATLVTSVATAEQIASSPMQAATALINMPIPAQPMQIATVLAKMAAASQPAMANNAASPGFASTHDLAIRRDAAPGRTLPLAGMTTPGMLQHLSIDSAARPARIQPLETGAAAQPIRMRMGNAAPSQMQTPPSADVAALTGSVNIKLGARLKKPADVSLAAPPQRNASAKAARQASDDTLPRELSCEARPDGGTLELEDAILSAICANPQARGAWANARAAAAALGAAKAAYVPSINATGGIDRNTLSTSYDYSAAGYGKIDQAQRGTSRQAALQMNWVLYDFGKRAAGRHRAEALLNATGAEYDAALQRVFFNAAQAYYAVQDALATATAARQAEAVAGAGMAVAKARHEAGAGGMSDLLQASTAYRRAQVERVNADGAVRAAHGVLAVAMGRTANTVLRVAPATDPENNAAQVSQNVDRLIETAKANRPSLEAARARLAATQADIDAARAQYWPTISLVGRLDTGSNPSTQQPLGSFPISGSHSSMVGVQVNIPLTDGIANRYRVAQARAARDAEQANVQDAELQASLDVWQAYQELQADAKNLGNTQTLLTEAIRSLDLARGRYKEGIGTLMELLNAQTAQADAQKQRIQAISRWRLARLKLAQSLGTLGLWDLAH